MALRASVGVSSYGTMRGLWSHVTSSFPLRRAFASSMSSLPWRSARGGPACQRHGSSRPGVDDSAASRVPSLRSSLPIPDPRPRQHLFRRSGRSSKRIWSPDAETPAGGVHPNRLHVARGIVDPRVNAVGLVDSIRNRGRIIVGRHRRFQRERRQACIMARHPTVPKSIIAVRFQRGGTLGCLDQPVFGVVTVVLGQGTKNGRRDSLRIQIAVIAAAALRRRTLAGIKVQPQDLARTEDPELQRALAK